MLMKTRTPSICPFLFDACKDHVYGLAPPTPDEILNFCLSKNHASCRIFKARKLVKVA
jgi:hypothetical protein